MPSVAVSLVEQVSDHRSSEAAYKFTMENRSAEALELVSITPRIPEEVTLLEVKDPSFVDARQKHAQLCSELTNLLDGQLLILSERVREDRAKALKDVLERVFKLSAVRAARILSTRTLSGKLLASWSKWEATHCSIENSADAERAFAEFFDDADVDDTWRKIYDYKLEKLQELEKDVADPQSASLATIEYQSDVVGKSMIASQHQSSSSRQGSESRRSRLGTWCFLKPSRQPHQVDGHRREDVLQMSLCHSSVPTAS